MSERICPFCGKPFKASRPWQKFDRDACRRRSHQQSYRKGEEATRLLERIREMLSDWKKQSSEIAEGVGERRDG